VEIHHTSEITPFIELRLWDDRDLPIFEKLTATVHGEGALAGIELAYNGMNGPNFYPRETPLGPSPRAMEAYRTAGAHLEDYPDGAASGLREAIGRTFGLDPDRIVCGAGSDDLLNLLARAYLADGDEAIHTTHGFLVYPIATRGAGARPIVAPETDYTADVDAILRAVTSESLSCAERRICTSLRSACQLGSNFATNMSMVSAPMSMVPPKFAVSVVSPLALNRISRFAARMSAIAEVLGSSCCICPVVTTPPAEPSSNAEKATVLRIGFIRVVL